MSIKNGDIVLNEYGMYLVYSHSSLGFHHNEYNETVIPMDRSQVMRALKNFLKTTDYQVGSILLAIEKEPEKFLEATSTNITMRVDSFEVGKPKGMILPITPKEVIAKKELTDKEILRVNEEIEHSWNGKFSVVQNASQSLCNFFEKYGWKAVYITGGEDRYQFWPKEK